MIDKIALIVQENEDKENENDENIDQEDISMENEFVEKVPSDKEAIESIINFIVSLKKFSNNKNK